MELIAGMLLIQTAAVLMTCGAVCRILLRMERSGKRYAAMTAEAARRQEEALRKLAGQMGAAMRAMKEDMPPEDDFMKDFRKIMNYTGAQHEK